MHPRIDSFLHGRGIGPRGTTHGRVRDRLRFGLALVCSCASFAHAATVEARPTICLVLSGGGARGAAHVGVLKVIEELRVPIDCIAGTSMGSIVGGAYAGGMKVDEMQAIIGEISTGRLFKETPPRSEQAMRRKQDDRSILFGVELGLKDGDIKLPKGAVTGVQLESVLRSLVRSPGYREFDALPIRYRAVATDLETGTAVIFDRGELASVMRASMSVPGAVAPAELGDKIFVDGGLTNNLPIDAARAMGADIVIAVNLGTPLMKRDELGSVLGVTGQMINILTEQNVRASLASLKPTDILIEPQLGDFSAANFDELAKTIPIGEAAARAVTDRLSKLSLPPEEFAAWRGRQLAAASAMEPQTIAEIRFAPMARVNPEAMRDLMKTEEGVPLDQQKLDRDMLRLFGTGDFEHVNYRIIEQADKRVLNVEAAEKSWGPNYLRFGLGLGSDLEGDSFFNLAASYRRTWVNSLGAEWRTDAQMGRTSRLATEFYQPLKANRSWFVAPRASFERHVTDVFSNSLRIARYNVRRTEAEVDLGATVGSVAEMRLGLLTGAVQASLDTGPPNLTPPQGHIGAGAIIARAIIDQLDSANFPRAGYAASMNVFASRQALGAADEYTRWDVDGTTATSFGRHTFSAAVKAGGPVGSGDIPAYDMFQWGGFLQQSGYPFGALMGQRLTFGRLGYTYKLADQRFFEGMYLGLSLEAGRMDDPLVPGNHPGLLKSGALYFGFDSPLGPLYLGFGQAADGNRSGYLYLGRP